MQTIKELRERNGMTQRDLASRIDVTTTTISAWERGMYEPRASQLRELARVFGVSMDAIDTVRPLQAKDDPTASEMPHDA